MSPTLSADRHAKPLVHQATRRVRRQARRARRAVMWAVRGHVVNPLIGRPIVNFLHIRKTAGSAVWAALYGIRPPDLDLRLHPHRVRLGDIPGSQYAFFFLRDPIARFVSGFDDGLRQGRPRYDKPWTPEEEIAFRHFSEPDSLASALWTDRHEQAARAMSAIRHVRSHYSDWLRSPEYLIARKDSLFFIGFQETMSADFALLCGKLGVDASLSEDPVASHRGRGAMESLSDQAMANLRRWYEEDYRILETAKAVAPEVNGHT